jgi:thiol:disulfide interchange protein DsbC
MRSALADLRPFAVALALGAAVASAGQPAAPTAPAPTPAAGAAVEPIDQVRAALTKRFPTLRIEGLRPAPIAGLWEFTIGMDVFYASGDARYIVRGDVIDLAGDRNLSEQRRAELRRGQLAKAAESDMIVFAPPRASHTVTVFTDIDCGYCRKLHSQIGEYLKLGIRVRYLPYPRAGLGSESWQKAQDVWCAKDRNGALTKAKRGESVPRVECDGAVVMRGVQLGELFRLDGTPMVISDDGYEIGGYLAPNEMKQRLDQLAQKRPRG